MSFFETLTQRQFNTACDLGMSDPVPLDKADLQKPFIYERTLGVFYVPFGHHQGAMGLLQAIQMGVQDHVEAAKKLGVMDLGDVADYWLENTPGAAFKSSVSGTVKVATGKGLTPLERRRFGDFDALFAR